MGTPKTLPFWMCLIISISLIVAGFCVPPMGAIDGSVLTAVGILFGFATLAQIPVIIEVAGYVKMTKGDITIEAKGLNSNENHKRNYQYQKDPGNYGNHEEDL